tara:strand:- start:65 stop:511 length:447 start_codon:yes stop_codon:yes gene_type:complete
MKISENLSLKEVVKSNTAIRLGIDNEPTRDHLENLIIIAEKVFQPIREHFKTPIGISSGYRSKELNTAVRGSSTSDHCKGMALDLDADIFEGVSNKEIFEFIRDNLEFTQLINEFNYSWVHVSYDKNNLKKQILTAEKKNGRTKYVKL